MKQEDLQHLQHAGSLADRKTNMHYLTPVFISVDPKDEPIKLRGFATKYHDRLIALSGKDANKVSSEQLWIQAFKYKVKLTSSARHAKLPQSSSWLPTLAACWHFQAFLQPSDI